MSTLPTSWQETDFENLLDKIIGGGTPSKANPSFFQGSIPFMTVKDMKLRFIADTIDHISDEAISSSATTLIPADTLVVATRMSLGKIVRSLTATAINQDLKALILADGISKTYIEYFWRASADHIQYLGTGTTVKGIRLEEIRRLQVPLAPRGEQQRIADKLDAVLARVCACNDRLDRILQIHKNFRQSVLASAVAGELTRDIRKLANADDSEFFAYPLIPFGNLIRSIRGGSTEVPSNDVSDFPILRSSSVRPGDINLSDVRFLRLDQSKQTNNFIETDDVLFTRLNGSVEYVGNCVVVPEIPSGAYQYPDRLFCAKLNDSLDPSYCMYAFSAPSVRREVETRAKSTAGHKRISIKDVREIEIRVPDILEQREIVRRVSILFEFSDRLLVRLNTARAAIERLTPALLAKAFRGELVPQDPNDEPASELLKRLAAGRDTDGDKPRRARAAKV